MIEMKILHPAYYTLSETKNLKRHLHKSDKCLNPMIYQSITCYQWSSVVAVRLSQFHVQPQNDHSARKFSLNLLLTSYYDHFFHNLST